jgi:hypothetical protein
MDDLENRLSVLGYARVRLRPERWQVSRSGAAPPSQRNRAAPQRKDPVLRFWLRRLGRFDASPLYRIRRAI